VLSEAFVGGGHAAFLPGGGEMLTVERRPQRAFTGREEDHEGRLVVRDPATRRPLAEMGAGGDGAARRGAPAGRPDRGGGLLRQRHADAGAPVRHGSGWRPAQRRGADALRPFPPPRTRWGSPISRRPRSRGRSDGREGGRLAPVGGLAPAETVHALSLVADLAHGEILMTFPGSNLVAVMDAADGTLRRTIDVGALGCRHPCGIGLLDARTWVVAGHGGGLFAFRRGDHAPRRSLWMDVDLAGHSHLQAV